jgi:DNA polymerase-1
MGEYLYITDINNAIQVLNQFKADKCLYLDTEVSIKDFSNQDYHQDKIRLLQLGNENITAVFDIIHLEDNLNLFINELKLILESKGIIGHNLKFDIKYLLGNFGIFPEIVFDTMIASQLLSQNRKDRFSLSAISFKYLGKTLDKSQQNSNWGLVELSEKQIEYAADDINILRELFPILRKKINSISSKKTSSGIISQIFGITNPVFSIEMAIVPVLAKMEMDGIPIDNESLEDLFKNLQKEVQGLFIDFKLKYGIDLDNNNQIAKFLTEKLDIKLPKEKDNYSIKEKYLKAFSNIPEIAKILEYKKKKYIFDKIKEIKGRLKGRRVYTEFKQVASPTGRIYSHNPNIQNLPSEIKGVIKSEDKKIIKADYSQIELRIVAEYLNEEKMINAFKNNLDLHKYTASQIFKKDYEDINDKERKIAKSINFGLIYGMTPKTLKEYIEGFGVKITLEEAKNFYNEFFKVYPKFAKWHQDIQNKLAKYKKLNVYSILGRKMQAVRFTDAINYPIQGTGSDIFKMAIALIFKEIQKNNLDCKLINLIHDEIMLEVSKKDYEKCKKLVIKNMERAGKLVLKKVPIVVEIK